MTDNYWNKFKATGKILDYINYTSCTNEDSVGLFDNSDNKGEKVHETSNGSYRDGIDLHANR